MYSININDQGSIVFADEVKEIVRLHKASVLDRTSINTGCLYFPCNVNGHTELYITDDLGSQSLVNSTALYKLRTHLRDNIDINISILDRFYHPVVGIDEDDIYEDCIYTGSGPHTGGDILVSKKTDGEKSWFNINLPQMRMRADSGNWITADNILTGIYNILTSNPDTVEEAKLFFSRLDTKLIEHMNEFYELLSATKE